MSLANIDNYPLLKSRVKAHQRRTKTGKIAQVRDYQTSKLKRYQPIDTNEKYAMPDKDIKPKYTARKKPEIKSELKEELPGKVVRYLDRVQKELETYATRDLELRKNELERSIKKTEVYRTKDARSSMTAWNELYKLSDNAKQAVLENNLMFRKELEIVNELINDKTNLQYNATRN